MTRIPFAQIDAFAGAPFTGNPAAVMPLAEWLDDATLQAIAEENNLAETAFLLPLAPGADADFELRWFTPRLEVALCGHATLASGHMILSAVPEMPQVRFRSRQSGVLVVARDGDGYRMRLPALAPQRAVTGPRAAAVAAALGATPAEIHERDGGYMMAVFEDPAEVRALAPDFRAIIALAPGSGLMIVATAPGEDSDVLSRVFVPEAGIDEDPVTGSAHCLIAPFWAARFGRPTFTAVQASPRGGRLGCEVTGDGVFLTGKCRTVIEGQFIL